MLHCGNAIQAGAAWPLVLSTRSSRLWLLCLPVSSGTSSSSLVQLAIGQVGRGVAQEQVVPQLMGNGLGRAPEVAIDLQQRGEVLV